MKFGCSHDRSDQGQSREPPLQWYTEKQRRVSKIRCGARIEAGTRGEVGQLPWGATWAMFPYIIVKDNEYYIRLYPSKNKPQVTYFVNEKIVDKKEFAEFLTPSERAKLLEPKELLCFNVKSSNIITICDNEKK